jgi:hypothetical protein
MESSKLYVSVLISQATSITQLSLFPSPTSPFYIPPASSKMTSALGASQESFLLQKEEK